MHLSRDDILKAEDLETREVDVPEWGGTVLVKALSGEERDAYESTLTRQRFNEKKQKITEPDMANLRAKLVARVIVDDDGKRVFSDGDIRELGQKSAAALSRVYEVAAELSGIGADAEEEELGNSEAAPSGVSTSDSPEPTA